VKVCGDVYVVPSTVIEPDGFAATVMDTVTASTFTLNDPDAEFPALSMAEQDTLVVPTGNVEPEAGVQVTGTEPSTRSEAEAENVTTAPLEFVA
jgi:hypothetical protein